MLVWNDRIIESSGVTYEFECCLKELCNEYTEVTHKNITSKELFDFYNPYTYQTIELDNFQMFDYDGLMGRVMSSSYVSINEPLIMEKIKSRMHEIFTKYQKDNQVLFPYKTTLFMGQLK